MDKSFEFFDTWLKLQRDSIDNWLGSQQELMDNWLKASKKTMLTFGTLASSQRGSPQLFDF